MKAIVLFGMILIISGCSSASRQLPAEYSGKWWQFGEGSNEVWRSSLHIMGTSFVTESEGFDISDSTNKAYSLRQESEVHALNRIKTVDGDAAYVIQLTGKREVAVPFTKDAAIKWQGLWGITDWKENVPRERTNNLSMTHNDLIGVDVTSSPHRLYFGYCPPTGRMEDVLPEKLGKEIYFQRGESGSALNGAKLR